MPLCVCVCLTGDACLLQRRPPLFLSLSPHRLLQTDAHPCGLGHKFIGLNSLRLGSHSDSSQLVDSTSTGDDSKPHTNFTGTSSDFFAGVTRSLTTSVLSSSLSLLFLLLLLFFLFLFFFFFSFPLRILCQIEFANFSLFRAIGSHSIQSAIQREKLRANHITCTL